MAAFGGCFEVAVRPRQLDDGFEIELGVVGQPSQTVGGWMFALRDRHLTRSESIQFLGGSVGHPHYIAVFAALHA